MKLQSNDQHWLWGRELGMHSTILGAEFEEGPRSHFFSTKHKLFRKGQKKLVGNKCEMFEFELRLKKSLCIKLENWE